MMFNSRGFKTVAAEKGLELERALVKASEGGKYPIVCDTSPCLATIKGQLQDSSLKYACCSRRLCVCPAEPRMMLFVLGAWSTESCSQLLRCMQSLDSAVWPAIQPTSRPPSASMCVWPVDVQI